MWPIIREKACACSPPGLSALVVRVASSLGDERSPCRCTYPSPIGIPHRRASGVDFGAPPGVTHARLRLLVHADGIAGDRTSELENGLGGVWGGRGTFDVRRPIEAFRPVVGEPLNNVGSRPDGDAPARTTIKPSARSGREFRRPPRGVDGNASGTESRSGAHRAAGPDRRWLGTTRQLRSRAPCVGPHRLARTLGRGPPWSAPLTCTIPLRRVAVGVHRLPGHVHLGGEDVAGA